MMFWRQKQGPADRPLVVGIERQGSMMFLRGRAVAGERPYACLGEAVIRTEDITRLYPLLAERMGLEDSEPIHLARETPLLVGTATSLSLSRHDPGYAVIRDSRELLHRAQWRAADATREISARYFGTTLEDLHSLGMIIQQRKESQEGVHLDLFCLSGPLGHERVTPSGVQQFFLPLVLARRIGTGATTEALLHIEDHTTVLAVRREDAFTHVRSLRMGIADILSTIEETLQCSPSDAESLLTSCAARRLSADGEKKLQRILRRLLPLWAGMMEVLADDLAENDRPQRMLLSGLFPSLVGRIFCRRPYLARCMMHPYRVEILPMRGTDARGMSTMLHALLEIMLRPPSSRTATPFVLPRSSVVHA